MRFFNITEIAPAIEIITLDKQDELLELLQKQEVIKPEDVVKTAATHLLNYACIKKRFRCATMILDFTNANPSALGSNKKSALDQALESSPIDHEFITAILSNYRRTNILPSIEHKRIATEHLRTAELTSSAVMVLLELANFAPMQTSSSSAASSITTKPKENKASKRTTSNLDDLAAVTVSSAAADSNNDPKRKKMRSAETSNGNVPYTQAASSSPAQDVISAWDNAIAHLKELTKFEEELNKKLQEYSSFSSNMSRVYRSLLSMTGCTTLEEVAAKFPQCRIEDAKFLNANHYSINQLLKKVADLIEQPMATVPPSIVQQQPYLGFGTQVPMQPMPALGLQPSPFMGFSQNASSYVPGIPFFPAPTDPANHQYFGAPPPRPF